MERKTLIIFLAIVLFFAGMSSISASSNLLKTETKDKVIFIQGEKGHFNYSWTFDKNEFKKNEFEFDMNIKFESPNITRINKLINNNIKKQMISFDYHGNLPSLATIKVPVSKNFKDGDRLNLYYYNDLTNKIEEVDTNLKVINGFVSFDIKHCSDYFLTLSIVKEAGAKSNNGIIIIGMLVIIVGLIGYTFFKNKK